MYRKIIVMTIIMATAFVNVFIFSFVSNIIIDKKTPMHISRGMEMFFRYEDKFVAVI